MSNVFIADDYASVSGGNASFYYGYEETIGSEDDEEWCFVVKLYGKEVMRIPRSKLGKHNDCAEYLLNGIAKWLEAKP